jgi:hypothetical protein
MQGKRKEIRLDEIKRELQEIGEMRPGSLNQQLTVCGRKGCRCQDPKKPQKHGPYFQLSYVHQGKSTTQFIQRDLVPMVEQELKNYKRFKVLTTEWVNLALAIAKEKLAVEKKRLKKEMKKKMIP